MMGQLDLDLDAPVTKTTGGLVVLPRDHPIVQRRQWSEKQIRQIGRSGCDQCSFCTELCPRYLLGHPVEPHKAMRGLGFSISQPEPHPGTQFCCECNLCSMFSCPEDLDPRNVCGLAKRKLAQKWTNPPLETLRIKNWFPNRRIPIKKLMKHIGLADYENTGALKLHQKCTVSHVVLPLKQHVGSPAQPVVKAGDHVTKGQLIGKAAPGQLGADLHASINGTIAQVDDKSIIIKQ